MFCLVVQTAVTDMLEPLDRLALIVAAFCHDIDHPGHNNAFEVRRAPVVPLSSFLYTGAVDEGGGGERGVCALGTVRCVRVVLVRLM